MFYIITEGVFIFRCFITNPYAGLAGLILPVLLLLVVVAVVFVKAFQVTPQWQAYDDIYRGRYNISGKAIAKLLMGGVTGLV